MDSNLIVLTDQDGNSVRFELLDIVEYKEDEYAVLYPADGGDDEPVHILRNSFAIPLLRYAGSVNILDSNPILPLGHPKYGGFSTNDIPLVAMMLSPSTAIQDTKVPSAI